MENGDYMDIMEAASNAPRFDQLTHEIYFRHQRSKQILEARGKRNSVEGAFRVTPVVDAVLVRTRAHIHRQSPRGRFSTLSSHRYDFLDRRLRHISESRP